MCLLVGGLASRSRLRPLSVATAGDRGNPSMPLSLSVGHTPLDWYCEPGDKLVDSAVVRQIFEVPEGADVRTEVDRIVVRIYELATDLSEFAGYFIRHYAR
jgi:hypothetical protein